MPGGRPTKMTPETVKKLELAFAIGCTDVEACLFADITRQTLTSYQNRNPKFFDRKQQLKKMPILQARTKVVEDIQGDSGTAKWYLERKCKDEFGPVNKIEAEIKAEHDISAALADMFNKKYKGEES